MSNALEPEARTTIELLLRRTLVRFVRCSTGSFIAEHCILVSVPRKTHPGVAKHNQALGRLSRELSCGHNALAVDGGLLLQRSVVFIEKME